MIRIKDTESYTTWFNSLVDSVAKGKINARLRSVSLGNFGDHVYVGEGVTELRIHYGPGYRVYLNRRGAEIVVLLGGGDKSTQKRDIANAQILAQEVKDDK